MRKVDRISELERELADVSGKLERLCTKFMPKDEPVNKLIHSIVQLMGSEDGMRVLRAKLYTEKLLEEAQKKIEWWTQTCAGWKADCDRAREERDGAYESLEALEKACNRELEASESRQRVLEQALRDILAASVSSNPRMWPDAMKAARSALAQGEPARTEEK